MTILLILAGILSFEPPLPLPSPSARLDGEIRTVSPAQWTPTFRPAVTALAETFAITIALTWAANPKEEQIVRYDVYCSTNVTGSFSLLTNTTGVSVVLNFKPDRYFFYVIPVNFWGEQAGPSDVVSTPLQATQAKNIILVRSNNFVAPLP